MAITVIIALLSAMVLSITFIPAAVALFITGKVSEKNNPIMRGAEWIYAPVLEASLRFRWLVIALALFTVTGVGWLASTMGSEFIPQLDEGDVTVQALRPPGTSLQQSIDMQDILERRLMEFPEVRDVFSRIGTPEIASDPMPPSISDTFVILKDRSEWPDPSREKRDLLEEWEETLAELPGQIYEVTQPIQMRFNELISGVRSDLGIMVFGEDLDQLGITAQEILEIVQKIEGAADARIEQTAGLPMLTLTPKREVLSRYGLSVRDAQHLISTAIGGESVGLIYEGDRRFPLVVRLPEEMRLDMDRIGRLPIPVPATANETGYVLLSEVVETELLSSPNRISRENGQRRVVVSANVRGRDLGSFVAEVREAIREQVDIPPGYFVQYGGTFEQLESASQRLSVVVPATLILIFGLLIIVLGSIRDSLIIFTGVPLALTGGVLALYIRGMPLSITAGVGFIALSGIAVLNGLVMLSFIKAMWQETGELLPSIIEGAMTRLRPVLMTALVASLGFIPMALNTGIGAEVQRPLATVVIGGIVSSTLLTLVLLPALYFIVNKNHQLAIK
jgi:cobalt-zinc-cadmium resistance protein CzcA